MAKAAPAKARKPARRPVAKVSRPASRDKGAEPAEDLAVGADDGGIEDAESEATDDAGPAAADVEPPESLTLASHYAYYDDDGALHVWAQDQVVTSMRDITDLIARGAPVKE
jgi:hypothetical protein